MTVFEPPSWRVEPEESLSLKLKLSSISVEPELRSVNTNSPEVFKLALTLPAKAVSIEVKKSWIVSVVLNVNHALAMGNYYFTDKNGKTVKVEYSFGYIKDNNGDLKINLHHSSFPYAHE